MGEANRWYWRVRLACRRQMSALALPQIECSTVKPSFQRALQRSPGQMHGISFESTKANAIRSLLVSGRVQRQTPCARRTTSRDRDSKASAVMSPLLTQRLNVTNRRMKCILPEALKKVARRNATRKLKKGHLWKRRRRAQRHFRPLSLVFLMCPCEHERTRLRKTRGRRSLPQLNLPSSRTRRHRICGTIKQ